MRIGICGAQGTGKSTLAFALHSIYNLPIIKEQAREAADFMEISKLSSLKNKDQKGVLYQELCLQYQLIAENKHNSFISDRTTVDNAIYWIKWHMSKANSLRSLAYLNMCKLNAKKYDLVFYIPPEIPLENDGFRSTNGYYREEMDKLAYWLLVAWEVNFVTIEGDFNCRVQTSREHLDKLGVEMRSPDNTEIILQKNFPQLIS